MTEGVHGTCGLCGEVNIILCLLLNAPPRTLHTDEFPPVGARSRNKYPLVLGSYPETDIVLPLICCDACSSLLVQQGESVDGEKVVDALPLLPLDDKTNKSTWLSALSGAFAHRFDHEIPVLVLLSVLWRNIDDMNVLVSPRTYAMISTLKQACSYLTGIPCLQLSIMEPEGESPMVGIDPQKPLPSTLASSLENLRTTNCQLLFYPLDGFVVLMQVADTANPGIPHIGTFIWLRTLSHLTEKHYYALRKGVGVAKATQSLRDIISDPSTTAKESKKSLGIEGPLESNLSVPIARLEGTYLLRTEEFATFKRLGDDFLTIKSTHECAIAAYLHVLLNEATEFANAVDFFDEMKSRQALADVFWAPEDMNKRR